MISKLKQSRINLNLTVEEVAQGLKIRKQYIVAIEENRLEDIPGNAYVNGYIKMYCNYLGLPYVEYQNALENMQEICPEPLFSNAKSLHRVSIAILLMTMLAAFGWYYISYETHQRSTIIERLANVDHRSYLSRSESNAGK